MARPLQPIILPGSDTCLFETRDADGRLLTLGTRARAFIRREGDALHFDGDFVVMRELVAGRALHRHVATASGDRWVETYRWNADGLPDLVDGAAIERNAAGAITGVTHAEGAWRYGYDVDGVLVTISGPAVRRRVEHERGRPARLIERGTAWPIHDEPGADGLQRDALGRVWQRRRPDGSVAATYLWDGFACIARIDGPPGDDARLSAVYSLDPSFTPVRITTRHGTRRVPRDAFGEGLLAIGDGPGLHGGMIAGERVLYRSRTLNPRIGAYTAPDPWPGDADDPRRAGGYRGPLLCDGGASAYTVCRNDPVGRIDPTGEVSSGVAALLMSLSTLTWSSQHTTASMFGLDLFNLFFGLFRGSRKRWFSKEGMYSRYLGAYGIRYDPVGLELFNINVDRAWTYQHVIWATRHEFDKLAAAAVFVPAADFTPRLNGTILRVTAAAEHGHPEQSFVLAGSRLDGGAAIGMDRPIGWTRCGGIARPAFPGSDTPVYPAGGIHFDATMPTVLAPRTATLTELGPTGVVLTGKRDRVRTLTLPQVGLGLTAGSKLAVNDGGWLNELVQVVSASESGGATRVVVTPTATMMRSATLGVLGLTPAGPSVPTLTLNPITGANALDPAGAAGPPIVPGEVFVLSQGPGVAGVVGVAKIAATLTVDVTIAAATGPSDHRVHLLQTAPGGTLTVVDASTVEFAAGTAPAAGTAIQVDGSATRILAADPGGVADRRVLDRALPAAISGARPWLKMLPGRALGKWDGVSGSKDLRYDAATTGTVPATGDVAIVDSTGAVEMVRAVAATGGEQLVMATTLPGDANTPYTAERFTLSSLNVSGATETIANATKVTAAIDASLRAVPQPALHILATMGPNATATGPELYGNVPLTNTGEIVIANPTLKDAPMPSQPVVVAWPAGTVAHTALALVKTVKLTVTLDRVIAAAAPPEGLTLMPLEADSFAYAARRDGADRVQLRAEAFKLRSAGANDVPDLSAAPRTVQFPRFGVGALVRIDAAGGLHDVFRVVAVDGASLKLAGGDLSRVPAGVDFSVRRMRPSSTGYARSQGSHRLGIAGRILSSTATRSKLQVEVPAPGALARLLFWALFDGTTAHPCNLISVDELAITLFQAPPGSAGQVDLRAIAIERASFAYAGSYTIDGDRLILPTDPPNQQLKATSDNLIIIPYGQTVQSVAGRLSDGTTMIPDDATESWYLGRRESLETHELRHTQQSALMGPLMLSCVPLLLIDDLLARINGGNLQAPEYSAYVPATVETAGGIRRLIVQDRDGIDFADGRRVQFAQGAQNPVIKLGAEQDGTFALIGSEAQILRDGPIYVRLQRTEGSEVFSWIQRIGSILSIGSLAQFVGANIIMGIPTLVAQTIHAAKGNGFGTAYWQTWYPARVPDTARPAAIELLGGAGEFDHNDRVLVRLPGSDTTEATTVVVAAGNRLELVDAPATDGAELRFEISPAGNNDPTRSLSDQFFSRIYNAEWLGWFYDPWQRLHAAVDAPPDSATDWILRTSRWAFSSTAWGPVLVTGIFFWDNLLQNAKRKGHLAFMEQQASSTSGNLYSWLARLRGETATVGDLARFRVFFAGGGWGTRVFPGLMDTPGVHRDPTPMATLPNVSTGAAGRPPFMTRTSVVADVASLPDQLFAKDFADPLNAAAPMGEPSPLRFQASDAGHLPTPPDLEMNSGSYVAFCTPGQHFLTGDPGVKPPPPPDLDDEAANAEEAQVKGAATIRFDLTVADVTVRAAGQPIVEGGVLKALPWQQIAVEVTPNGAKVYELGMLRPGEGPLLRSSDARAILVQGTTGSEAVEVRRVHAAQPTSTVENTASAWPQVTLDRPIVVPVRRFRIDVVAEWPVRGSLEPGLDGSPPEKTEAKPGDTVFIVLPVRFDTRLAEVITPSAPAPANMTNPRFRYAPEPTPAPLAEHVGFGSITRVTLDAVEPPEEEVTVEWTAKVSGRAEPGGARPTADVKLRLLYKPHFRLVLPASGDVFAPGPAVDLAADGATIASVTVLGADGTPSAAVTAEPMAGGGGVSVTVQAGAGPGLRRIVATASDGKVGRRTIRVNGP